MARDPRTAVIVIRFVAGARSKVCRIAAVKTVATLTERDV